MAGFRFRLEVVERVRKQAMDAQRREVAVAIRELDERERSLIAANDELAQNAQALRVSRGAGQLDVTSLMTQQLHRGQLVRRLAALGIERRQGEEKLSTERTKLAESTKRLKVIEKLREKQWARYQLDVRRREQALTDEMSLQRYIANVREREAVISELG